MMCVCVCIQKGVSVLLNCTEQVVKCDFSWINSHFLGNPNIFESFQKPDKLNTVLKTKTTIVKKLD